MKIITALLLCLFTSVGIASEKPAKAAQCEACHGANGSAPIMDAYPKLNGQNKGYLISALKDYRGGKRTGALSAVMTAQSTPLSDEDIEALAAYYSSQK